MNNKLLGAFLCSLKKKKRKNVIKISYLIQCITWFLYLTSRAINVKPLGILRLFSSVASRRFSRDFYKTCFLGQLLLPRFRD